MEPKFVESIILERISFTVNKEGFKVEEHLFFELRFNAFRSQSLMFVRQYQAVFVKRTSEGYLYEVRDEFFDLFVKGKDLGEFVVQWRVPELEPPSEYPPSYTSLGYDDSSIPLNTLRGRHGEGYKKHHYPEIDDDLPSDAESHDHIGGQGVGAILCARISTRGIYENWRKAKKMLREEASGISNLNLFSHLHHDVSDLIASYALEAICVGT